MSSLALWKDPTGRVVAQWEKGTIYQQDRGGIYTVWVTEWTDPRGIHHGRVHGPYTTEQGAIRAAKRFAKLKNQ